MLRPRLLLLLVFAACAPAGPAPPAERDVVLVTLDTTRADRLGCYGYERETTPFLDRLAERGARFERCTAAAPLTLVSHASILTGLDPPRHGVRNNGHYVLGDDLATVATLLRRAGRATGAFVSAPVLDARHGLARGFETYDDDLTAERAPGRFQARVRPAGRTVERAVAWLEGLPADARAFLWVHLFDPHAPYVPPAAGTSFGASLSDRYDGEIRAADDALLELDRALDRLARPALWVVTADHGESLGEHGELTHGTLLYDSTLLVPLIVAAPGWTAPRVVPTGVRHVDLLPTLLDLLELPVPVGLDGRSLAPAVRSGAALAPAPAYAESYHTFEVYGWSPLAARVEDGWKFVDAPRPELYDLGADPLELVDRRPDEPDRAAALGAALEESAERGARFARGADALDERTRFELAALGYAGSPPTAPQEEDLPDPKDRIHVLAALDGAQALIEAGRAREGIALVQRTLPDDPENPRLLAHAALEPLRLLEDEPDAPERAELLAAAESALAAWRRVRPDDPDGRFAAALADELAGEVGNARREYERLRREHPGHVKSLEALLRLALGGDDVERAREVGAELLATEREGEWVRHALARLELEAGAHAAALLHYEVLVERADEDATLALALVRSGQCLQALGRHAEALEAFEGVPPALSEMPPLPELVRRSRAAVDQ